MYSILLGKINISSVSFVKPPHNRIIIVILLLPWNRIVFMVGLFTGKNLRLTQASSYKGQAEW